MDFFPLGQLVQYLSEYELFLTSYDTCIGEGCITTQVVACVRGRMHVCVLALV